MGNGESLGIKRLEAIHYYVHDLRRSERFYRDRFDFEVLAESGPELEQRGKQRSKLFSAGDCLVLCSQPLEPGGRASRFLKKHPDGVGTLIFEVEDVARAFAVLEARGGTPIRDVAWMESDAGRLGVFGITTPFGSSTFRFVQREGDFWMPGMQTVTTQLQADGGGNAVGFRHFDHVTSNFETMAPALLWLKHVLGFESYWSIQFHTEDIAEGAGTGSGLKSEVCWDPASGVKFANNEPLRPYFKQSQINLFAEDQRGDGIQHVALAVDDIVAAVRELRSRGVEFMPTPAAYYDMLPARLEELGVGRIDEDLQELRELEILVDGKGSGSYLLQIFLQDSAKTHGEHQAGPFFFEIIQRKGDKGFGGGNFRALFESIEREQNTRATLPDGAS